MRFIFLLGMYILLLTGLTTYTENTPTTTPAPSKTPTAAATQEPATTTTPTQEATATPETRLEPFTQADLNMLTGNVQRPNGFAWFDGRLYAACNGDWTLYSLDDTTGFTETFVFGVRDANTLYIEETEAGFDIWIPDFATNSLVRVNQNRAAPVTLTTRLNGPWGIAAVEEQFFVTNLRGNSISILGRDGFTENVLEGFRSPTGIAVHDDVVYVANNGSARRAIEWFGLEELENDTFLPKPLVSGLQNVGGLVLAEDGYLYFTYALGTRGVVGRINPELCMETGCMNDQVEIVIYTELPAPLAGLIVLPDMRLYVHAIYRPEIYWIQLPVPDDPQG